MFKLKKQERKLEVGLFFYCYDGNERWQWHVITEINEQTGEMAFTWVAQAGKANWLADPLVMGIEQFLRDRENGDWRLSDGSDPRIPEILKSAYVQFEGKWIT